MKLTGPSQAASSHTHPYLLGGAEQWAQLPSIVCDTWLDLGAGSVLSVLFPTYNPLGLLTDSPAHL